MDTDSQDTWKLPALKADPRVRVPTLTLLSHHDMERVGQTARLVELLKPGRTVELSRTSPAFGEAADPIGDVYLSRRPALLESLPSGGLRLTTEPKGLTLAVDEGGDLLPLRGRREFNAAELDAGVALALGTLDESGAFRPRVALYLQRAGALQASGPDYGMIGQSPAVQQVRDDVTNVAEYECDVLIRGQTGTGKELVARAVHAASPRSTGPFVAASMAEIQAQTGRSELFGHVRGAFTGAERAHAGLFEQADGGTLFLDEVGEASSAIQAMLLRCLETRTVRRLGDDRDRPVDVRLLAATDADLEAGVDGGTFHAALLNRLESYVIEVPRLRERGADIARLVVHFLREVLSEKGQQGLLRAEPRAPRLWFPPALMLALVRADWPGNVRELRNVVRQLVISSGGRQRLEATGTGLRLMTTRAETSSSELPTLRTPTRTGGQAVDVTADDVLAALERHRYKANPAATELGIARSTLYKLIDADPRIRKAKDIGLEELQAALESCDGDVEQAVSVLRVSARAIKLRMKELGLR